MSAVAVNARKTAYLLTAPFRPLVLLSPRSGSGHLVFHGAGAEFLAGEK